MKNGFPLVILLILVCFATGSSQVVADRGNFGLHTVNDSILQYKYLERENQLLIIGWRNVQLLDLTNFKTIDTWPLEMPVSNRRPDYLGMDWPISPDEKYLLLVKKHKSAASENRLLAWELDGGIEPK